MHLKHRRSRMKTIEAVKICFATSLVLGIVSGCATEADMKFVTNDEHYQKLIEKQKAGLELEAPLKELPEMTIEEHEELGDAHLRQGRLLEAGAQYSQVLEKDPTRNHTRYKLAVLLLENRKPDLAIRQFEKVLSQDSTFALAHEGMGHAYLVMGVHGEADKAFRTALSLDPKLWKAHNYLGIISDQRHLHLSAIEAYKAALKINPNEPTVLNNLGMSYYMNRQYTEAVKAFHQALQTGAESPKVANNLGLALSKLGRYEQAFDAFRRGTDGPKAYNNVGIALLEAGKPHQAVTCFEKAIALQPNFYERANENLSHAKRVLAKNVNAEAKKNVNAPPCY